MIKTLHAIFDGKVLKPEGSVDLDVGKRYVLTVERTIETKVPRKEPPYPLTQILDIATDVGVDDLSTRHDWYAHVPHVKKSNFFFNLSVEFMYSFKANVQNLKFIRI